MGESANRSLHNQVTTLIKASVDFKDDQANLSKQAKITNMKQI